MLKLDLSDADLPDEIVSGLNTLSANIDIDKQAPKGANGYLFFGTNRILDRRVAIKFYYWGGDKQYHAEPNALAEVSSPNILKVYHADTIADEWAYYIADYCKNGDLDDNRLAHPFSVKESLNALVGVLNGVSVLHERQLVHRDLKPQNILYDDRGQTVIGDFGSVKRIPEGQNWTAGSQHSVLYRPPEAFGRQGYYKQSDFYQVGIVLYQLLGGNLPYGERDHLSEKEKRKFDSILDPVDRSIFVDEAIARKISRGKLLNPKSLPPWIPRKLRTIVTKATALNHEHRYPTSSDMINALVQARRSCSNWRPAEDALYLEERTVYRIFLDKSGTYAVQKKKHSNWRNVNVLSGFRKLHEVVSEVERSL
jgi:serine/threonine protein kinase